MWINLIFTNYLQIYLNFVVYGKLSSCIPNYFENDVLKTSGSVWQKNSSNVRIH